MEWNVEISKIQFDIIKIIKSKFSYLTFWKYVPILAAWWQYFQRCISCSLCLLWYIKYWAHSRYFSRNWNLALILFFPNFNILCLCLFTTKETIVLGKYGLHFLPLKQVSLLGYTPTIHNVAEPKSYQVLLDILFTARFEINDQSQNLMLIFAELTQCLAKFRFILKYKTHNGGGFKLF